MQRVHETLKDKEATVLAIAIDGSGEKVVKPYIAEHGYTFPTLVDQRMEVARQFGARGVPFTIVVNREGKIVARGLGPFPLDTPEFSQYLQALMAQGRG